MYSVKKLEEILCLDNYKLCYIEKINEYYSDWTPETMEYMKTDQYKHDQTIYGWNNPNLVLKNYPNPDYIPGICEYYAYFTPQNMNEVWGDDWNDRPYEHNAEYPYDSDNIEIIKVPFGYPDCLWEGSNLTIKQPLDWNYCGNSPFTCEDINLGAVPWIFAKTETRESVCITASCCPKEFYTKLCKIKELAKDRYESLGCYDGIEFIKNIDTGFVRFFKNNTPVIIEDNYQVDYESWNSMKLLKNI